MMKKIVLLSLTLLFAGRSYGTEAQKVNARMEGDRIVVQVGEEKFTEYLFGKEHKYPFFYPVNGPASGKSVTAWDQEPYPHHSSLYASLDAVRSGGGTANYWQPRGKLETGQVLSRNPRILKNEDERVVLQDKADWIIPAQDIHQLQDIRTVSIWAPSPTIRIMDFKIELKALKDVDIGPTGHSFFSARMRPELAVGNQDGSTQGPKAVLDMGTGTIVDSNGNRNESGIRGKAPDWCAYYGDNNGFTEGLAIIQHSENPFYPAKWFIRDYGFMSPTPFAFDGKRSLKAGETLTFRYRVVVFKGDYKESDIAGWREDFEAQPDSEDQSIAALYVTGGGWHDFEAQEEVITKGLGDRLNIKWTIDHEAGKRKDFMPTRFEDADWIEPYDVVIYNQGITHLPVKKQKELTERVAGAHRDTGIPAVFIHNTLHFGRKMDQWHDFTGVVTRSHERPRSAEIRNIAPDHFIMAKFPDNWTPKVVEPYIVAGVRENVQPLAKVYGADRDEWYVCYWTHQYGKARIFGTTIGHENDTIADPIYLDTLARGILWAIDKEQLKWKDK